MLSAENVSGKIIAVDFDGTLCNSKFPNCGDVIAETAELIRKCSQNGATIILWTCRDGDDLQRAVDWCKSENIPIDYVNQNVPEQIEKFGNDCRKINADYYIDDKSVNVSEIIANSSAEFSERKALLKTKLEGLKC